MSYMYRSKPEILRFQPYTPFHFSFTVPFRDKLCKQRVQESRILITDYIKTLQETSRENIKNNKISNLFLLNRIRRLFNILNDKILNFAENLKMLNKL